MYEENFLGLAINRVCTINVSMSADIQSSRDVDRSSDNELNLRGVGIIVTKEFSRHIQENKTTYGNEFHYSRQYLFT
jgi:hypothetical protein